MANGNGNGKNLIQWWPLLLSLIAGAAAFASLRSDVRHNEEMLATKASAETVQIQYEVIQQQLADIKELIRNREEP